ncbi:developmental pluripotency-associated protein 4 isoform X1 [Phyllostomus discolor]|uniref:Developmental pluripotency-associated protein 4 isoform X1 n=1 Tax=Phyllostomus discolor TaxID=89673 RepID=A0A7E6D6M9_9CHIR|nr:developmental pluripotency-associated protein 4 isoform X1 [Phyllostomus discolor]
MEDAKGKKCKSKKKSGGKKMASKFQPVKAEEEHQAAGESSTERTSGKENKRKRSKKDDKASHPQEMAQDNERVRIRKKIPIPPLPLKLPPVDVLHRDIVRAWCQQLKLSTKGLKVEAYKRLCEYAYPNQTYIPVSSREARVLTESKRKLKMEKEGITLESFGLPEVTAPPEEGVPYLGGATALLEGMDSAVVTTSTPEAVFASWSRIAASAGQMETLQSPQEASGVRWCVVHGRSLPADTEGWVKLQFYAGQAWVPEKRGKVCALFLLPTCSLPPPHLEDNMLCPKCVHRNKVLMKSLQ